MNASESSARAAGPAASSEYALFLSRLLSDRDRFFAEVAESEGLGRKIAYSAATLGVFSALYGAAAGAYAGPLQSLSAAIKLPLLFAATLLICFPGFFVIQVLVGSRLRLAQMLALVAGSLALAAILLAAVIPVTLFFLITGANYHFLSLLHVVIVLGAGLVGMVALHDGLAFACEKRGVYPRSAMTIMKAWAVLFAFVGVQMAWNLLPFVGDRGEPFQLFRHHQGNFYTAIVYSVQQLARGERPAASPAPARLPRLPDIRTGLPADSTVAPRP